MAKGRHLFLLQVTLHGPVSGVGRKSGSLCGILQTPTMGKVRAVLHGSWREMSAWWSSRPSPAPPTQFPVSLTSENKHSIVLDKHRCFASFSSRFTCLSQICSCYSHGWSVDGNVTASTSKIGRNTNAKCPWLPSAPPAQPCLGAGAFLCPVCKPQGPARGQQWPWGGLSVLQKENSLAERLPCIEFS